MALSLTAYPLCCKALCLTGFGSGHLSESDVYRDLMKTKHAPRVSAEEIKRYLDGAALGQTQVIFACPTVHQPEAIQALKDYGFHCADEEDWVHGTSQKVWPLKPGSSWDYDTKAEPTIIEHQMVPMFYLVPRNRVPK